MSFDSLVILGSSITALALVRDAHAHRLRSTVIDTTIGLATFSRWANPISLDSVSNIAEVVASQGGPRVALVSSADNWLRFVIEHRSQLESAFGSVLHPGNDSLEICLDKLRFANWCATLGLPTPLSWIGNEAPVPSKARFPLLIRPAQTLHSQQEIQLPKAIEVHDRDELDRWLARYALTAVKPLVSESLLARKLEQVSVGFARAGSQTISFTARKIRPLAERCSVGSCVELYPDPAADDLARRAVDALDYHGIGEVEILRDLDSGELFIIEINARPWLQYALGPQSGHDFLSLLLHTPHPSPRPRLTQGKTWISFNDDLFNAFSRSVGVVRNGKLGLVPYVASLFRSNVFAVLDVNDLKPFFAALRHDHR